MPSVSERYLKATRSSHLQQQENTCDVDVLTAAGWADQGLALSLYRLRATKTGFDATAEAANEWLRVKAKRKGIRDGGVASLHKVVRPTLFWWLDPHCRTCHGRGYHTVDGAPMLNPAKPCRKCKTTGKDPLPVEKHHIPAAQLLVAELERSTEVVFARMNRCLRG